MRTVDWVIKASKLCNLRCRYCYEWNSLGDRKRMSLVTWAQVLTAIRDHNIALENRFGAPIQSNIIWHGGEPLLLPDDYFREVFRLQDKIFPQSWVSERRLHNSIQSNLFAVPDSRLALLAERGVGLGISHDFVPGVRLSKSGKDSGAQVERNLERLHAHGISYGLLLVLAGHTAPHLRKAFDRACELTDQLRVLPLFHGPDERPMAGVHLEREELIAALLDLFEHWLARGCPIAVDPLDRHLQTVLMRHLGLAQEPYDRRHEGNAVFVVGLDGTIDLPVGRAGGSAGLGRLTEQTIDQIIRGSAYQQSLDEEDSARTEICGSCRYRGPCSTYPLFENPDGSLEQRQCQVAHDICAGIERSLAAKGVDARASRQMLHADLGLSRNGGFAEDPRNPDAKAIVV